MKISKIMLCACTAALAAVCMAFSASAADEEYLAIDETNFPSEIIRDYLKEKVDLDGDEAISPEEMPRTRNIIFDRIVVDMNEPDENIPVIDLTGIDLLTEMRSLVVSNYNITNADFTSCDNLESLALNCKKMDGFVLTDLPHLDSLSLSTDIYTEFKLENFQSLTSFSFDNSPNLKKLEIKNVPQLNIFTCHNNSLVSLEMDTCPDLQVVDCSDNKLTKFDLSKTPNIQTFYCTGNMIAQLDISNCQYLIRNIKEYDPQEGGAAYPIEADKSTNIIGMELTTTQDSEQSSTQSTANESSDTEAFENKQSSTPLIIFCVAICVIVTAVIVVTVVMRGGKNDENKE